MAGATAAILVVAARLALPWPLRAIANQWMHIPGAEASAGIAGIDPVLLWGGLFFVAVAVLGLADLLERLFFARLAIGTVRDLRRRARDKALDIARNEATIKRGDLIARIVGDAARVKSGLQGFMVHVATSSLLFIGVTVILFALNWKLGAVFAVVVGITGGIVLNGARTMFKKSLKKRKKEGRFAENLHKALGQAGKQQTVELKALEGGLNEASQVRTQGIVTWLAHIMFGAAVLACLWIGADAVSAGTLQPGDMVLFMLYALMLRGPLVRLARQGSRTGKILGAAHRLLTLANRPPTPVADAPQGDGDLINPSTMTVRETPHMSTSTTTRILFTGYAPVHFICFLPLYKQLAARPDVEIFVSGGTRIKQPLPADAAPDARPEITYDAADLYEPFDIDPAHILTTDEISEMDVDVLFSAHTTLIMPRSAAKKIQIFHGVSFRNSSIRSDNMGCDHYFMVGPYQRRQFEQAGLLTEDDPRAVSVGFMKTDPLCDASLDRTQLVRDLGFSGDRPVIVYAPTGAKMNSLVTMGEDVIHNILESEKYDLVLKLHDHDRLSVDWPSRLAPLLGDHFRIEREADVIPLLNAADLLITDASSVGNEYALLDRPMIFLDTPELLAKAGEGANSMLDLNTWGRKGGEVVQRSGKVVSVIDAALADGDAHSDARRAMVADLFYNQGCATQVAMEWVEANLLSQSPVEAMA